MNSHQENYNPNDLKNQETGSHGKSERFKEITYSFGKYQIKILLTLSNKFIGVTEVKINKEFLSYKQKTALRGFHDVDKFYPK